MRSSSRARCRLIAFVVLAVVGIAAQVRTFPTYVLDPEGPRFA